MSTIGTLTAIIAANTSGFEQGMKRTQSAMGGVGGSAKGLGSIMSGPLAVGMGIAAAGIGAVAAMTNTLKRMDDLVDTADQIGIATDSLISLRFAADQGGSSAAGMDAALGTMVKNVGLTSMGMGKAGKSIDELGLNVEQLRGMAPDKMFSTFADAISKHGNKSEQAALASRIFGDEGKKLISVLRGGSAGLEEYNRQAEASGRLLGDGAREAAEAHDALGRMGGTVQALSDKLTIALVPAIVATEGALSRSMPTIIEFTEGVADSFADVARLVEFVLNGFENPTVIQSGINRALEDSLKKAAGEAANLNDEMDKLAAKQEDEIMKIMFGLGNKLNGPESTMDQLKRLGAAPEMLAEADRMQKAIDSHKALTDSIKEENEAYDKLREAAERVFDFTRTPIEKLQDEMDNLRELFNKSLIDFATFSRAADNLQADFNSTIPKAEQSRSVGFAAQGSAAAFSIVNQNRQSGLESIARQQLRKQAEQIAAVKDVVKEVGQLREELSVVRL